MAKIHYKILKSWLTGKICLFIVVQKFSHVSKCQFFRGKIVYPEKVTTLSPLCNLHIFRMTKACCMLQFCKFPLGKILARREIILYHREPKCFSLRPNRPRWTQRGGGATLSCGCRGAGRRSQFGRLERKPGTLHTLCVLANCCKCRKDADAKISFYYTVCRPTKRAVKNIKVETSK